MTGKQRIAAAWAAIKRDLIIAGRWAESSGLCFFRKWWRPMTCVIAAGTVAVNGIYLPIHNHQAADLTGLATLLAALSPWALARSAELIMGRKDDPNAS